MTKTLTYICGSIILPDGRLVLTAEGMGDKLVADRRMALSVETYVSLLNEENLKTGIALEIKQQLGINSKFLNHVGTKSTVIKFKGFTERKTILFVYKLNTKLTFKINSPEINVVEFLSLSKIIREVFSYKIRLSTCAEQMLEYLRCINTNETQLYPKDLFK